MKSIILVNGSIITPIDSNDNKCIRGQRVKIIDWSDLNDYDKEQLDKMLAEYIEK